MRIYEMIAKEVDEDFLMKEVEVRDTTMCNCGIVKGLWMKYCPLCGKSFIKIEKEFIKEFDQVKKTLFGLDVVKCNNRKYYIGKIVCVFNTENVSSRRITLDVKIKNLNRFNDLEGLYINRLEEMGWKCGDVDEYMVKEFDYDEDTF